MVLNLQATCAFDYDDGPIDRQGRLFCIEVYVRPVNGKGLADAGAGGQHDVHNV